jgi:hypothetical protein
MKSSSVASEYSGGALFERNVESADDSQCTRSISSHFRNQEMKRLPTNLADREQYAKSFIYSKDSLVICA